MNFRWELFDDPTEYEEVALCDRKEDFPHIRNRGGDIEKKAELIRDVIALANTARLFGQPAYLLFGIDNGGNICGISQYLEHYRDNSAWSTVQLKEKARQEVARSFENHIEPILMTHELKFGERDGLTVAYLLIPPTSNPTPFVVKMQLDNIKKPLQTNDCWIRMGESKLSIDSKKIAPDEDPYRYAHAVVPCLLPSAWSRYFQSLLADQVLASDAQVPGYQDPLTANAEDLNEVTTQFLASNERLLVIRGAAGIGKSTFLRRMVYLLADSADHEVNEIRQREEFHPPPGWIPIYMSLRNRQNSLADYQSLIDALLYVANSSRAFWNESKPDHPEKLFEYNSLHWVFCLDGLDEIWDDQLRRTFLTSLRETLDRLPRVKFVLTTRPHASSIDWSNFPNCRVCGIQPLSPVQITAYVSNFVRNEELEQILNFINGHQDILHLCSYPSYLVAATQELVGQIEIRPQDWLESPIQNQLDIDLVNEIAMASDQEAIMEILPKPISSDEFTVKEPLTDEFLVVEEERPEPEELPIRLGTVLHRIYFDYLWQREIERLGIEPMQANSWWNGAAMLAIETDGHRRSFRYGVAAGYLETQEALACLLNLGILTQSRSNVLSFFTNITKEFFAACAIIPYQETKEHAGMQALLEQCTREFRNGVLAILMDIFNEIPNHTN